MKYRVTLNGRTYEVEVEAGRAMLADEYEAYAPVPAVAPASPAPVPAAAPAAPAVAASGEVIKAPMSGTVLKLPVQQGQKVKKGQVLVILEAMKMENEIVAPRDGTVSQVVAAKGSAVESGAPLVVLA